MSVSAVIPAYNAEASISKALESVLRQTRPVDEIIVVDDGSTDQTLSIVASYGSRVRLIRQENQGPSVARNLGVRSATSAWIAFLDADDAWQPDKVEKQLAALGKTPGAALCYTGLLNLNMDGSQTVQAASPIETLPATLRLGNPAITPSCVMLSRDVFLQAGGFRTRLRGSEDWDLWLTLTRIGPFCVVDEPLTLYQVSNTGLSSDADHMLREAKTILEDRLLDGLSGVSYFVWRRRILSYQSYKAALTARAADQRSRELAYIVQSISTWPSPAWYPRRFKVLAVSLKNVIRKDFKV